MILADSKPPQAAQRFSSEIFLPGVHSFLELSRHQALISNASQEISLLTSRQH